jgi:hypothetical protein
MSAEGDEIITLQYDQLIDSRETKLAWCFSFECTIYFLPKSQVEDIRETAKEVDLPRWLAESKGLEAYEV